MTNKEILVGAGIAGALGLLLWWATRPVAFAVAPAPALPGAAPGMPPGFFNPFAAGSPIQSAIAPTVGVSVPVSPQVASAVQGGQQLLSAAGVSIPGISAVHGIGALAARARRY